MEALTKLLEAKIDRQRAFAEHREPSDLDLAEKVAFDIEHVKLFDASLEADLAYKRAIEATARAIPQPQSAEA